MVFYLSKTVHAQYFFFFWELYMHNHTSIVLVDTNTELSVTEYPPQR